MFFRKFIEESVDKRINELISDKDYFSLRVDVDESTAKTDIKEYLQSRKKDGVNHVTTLDIVLNTRIPADKVETSLSALKEDKAKNMSYAS